MTKSTNSEFIYEVVISEDPETGDLILPIPPEIMRKLNFAEGDSLNFDKDDLGRFVISKKS